MDAFTSTEISVGSVSHPVAVRRRKAESGPEARTSPEALWQTVVRGTPKGTGFIQVQPVAPAGSERERSAMEIAARDAMREVRPDAEFLK